MFTTPRPQLNSIIRHAPRRQRGQSIVVALLVLLLLGLAGALFVTIVARNLINAGHSNRVQTADQYAAAGITYVDSQLSNSIDGADWRPPLQFQLAAANLPTEARELARYNAVKSTLTDPTAAPYSSDPDLEYLVAGYTRYNTGAGRYLVRVTYDPVNLSNQAVPPGKYLKIESIGREGNIDALDPTTYTNNRSTDRTQSYLVAYKPIGITDYARFETNPDKRSDIANLGVVSQFYSANTDGGIATPGVSDFNRTGSTGNAGSNGTAPTIQEYPVVTTYGAADAYLYQTGTAGPFQVNPNAGSGTAVMGYTFAPGGGSIHANMTTRFFGTNIIYLNIGATYPLYQDEAEIGGSLLLDSYDPQSSLDNTKPDNTGNTPVGQQASLILNPVDITKLTATPIAAKPPTLTPPAPAMPPMNTYIAPSNATGTQAFDTFGGLVRDGSTQNDPEGLPRSITRLEPPLVDAQDNASQMPRYRAIAMNSAPRPNLKNPDGTAYTGGGNPSLYGYGKAIYVNNSNDTQQDSASIGGGSTLTDEWLHRSAANSADAGKGGWNGLFYNPPGVTIVLGQQLTPPANANTAGVYGIRLTRSNGDSFVGPDGTTNAGPEMDVSYADLGAEATDANLNAGTSPDNDIIIYAEGNVRVRGVASPNEGTDNTAANEKYVPRHITIVTGGTAYIEGNLLKGSPDSSISVLAHDYVCINTTQFLAGAVQGQLPQIAAGTPDAPLNPSVPLTDGYLFTQQFGFGFTNPGATTPQTPTTQYGGKLALYVSGNTPNGLAQADFNILDAAGNTVFNTSVSNTTFNSSTGFPMPTFSTLTHLTFDLSNTTLASLTGATGDSTFQLTAQKDPGNIAADTTQTPNLPGSNPAANQDPLLERVAVLPMDIRIEAVLYAQTGSFFVIPGDWFNTNADDNLSTYLNTFEPMNPNKTPISPDGTRPDIGDAAPGSPAFISISRFPMYGQPIDLKITIDGSVSEAHPADIAAQTAWMLHWGWIPQYHGSLVVSSSGNGVGSTGVEGAGHPLAGQPAIGLQIIYDPQAGYPYSPSATNGTQTSYYLRSDAFGRPLPFTPKLPVSTGLLYSGQSGEAPLLQ